MRISLLTFCLLFGLNSLYAQFGVNARYLNQDAKDWDFPSTELPGDGYSVGIDYWFRLKNTRIEFLPELNFSSSSASSFNNTELTTQWYSFYFNTNIYVLDLLSDCNCPTFSKQNDFFKKGFFVQISPGVGLPRFSHDFQASEIDNETQTGDFTFSIGAGLGLDIGINDIVTITPMINARYFPEVSWENQFPGIVPDTEIIDPNPKSDLLQFSGGIRIGFRLDDW